MRVVFCASEVFPFAKTGGLADVTGALPLALAKLGLTIDIFIPEYKCINHEHDRRELDENLSVVDFAENVTVYLIGHEHYYDRDALYGDKHGDYPDNLERFQYFCRKSLDALLKQNLKPDIIHCHDWQTALIPVYLKTIYREKELFKSARTLLTIHNLVYQGVFLREQYPVLGLPQELFADKGFEFHGRINLLKAGIVFADEISTVSPQYAREILTERYGAGLQDVIAASHGTVSGILNGIDYAVWNAKTDAYIPRRFGLDDVEQGKTANKNALRRKLDLPADNDSPILGFVGRLSHQKGLDLIIDAIPSILAINCQVVIQGVGDANYESRLNALCRRHPDRVVFRSSFDETLAHQVYAGSDMFMMPSNYEPCGLSQLISMAYGTIPLVYKTGGLADTVITPGAQSRNANGFMFNEYTPAAFVLMTEEAREFFKDKPKWHALRENAMRACYSWENSAREYRNLYQCLLSA